MSPTDFMFDPAELRVWRARHGVRQRDLAKMLEVAPQRISDWETQLRRPTPTQLVRLFAVLHEQSQS
ncbi:MAG: helix-turn-helix domain-containing protein [Candidatus Polarisedimenticolia bacterium]